MKKASTKDWKVILPIVLSLLSFSTYLVTIAPTLTWRNDGADGGDLIAAAYTLGIPHPTGYPVYIMLAKLFTLLPVGDVAYRVNLMSAFFAAATVGLIYFIVLGLCELSLWAGEADKREYISSVAASTAALAFAFSPTFWSQATIAEVYSLNAFFVALLFYLLLKWMADSKQQRAASVIQPPASCLLLAALTYGLSLGNHFSMLLLAPAGLFLISQGNYRALLKPKTLIAMGLAFLLGLAVYLYLPLRASQNPPINWGNPCAWSGFFWLVSGAQYRRFVFSLPLVHLPGRVCAWANLLTQQFDWWGLLLGLVGLWYCSRNQRSLLASSVFSFGTISIYAIGYNTTDSYVYLIPSYLIFAIWLGVGIHHLLAALARLGERTQIKILVPFGLALLLLLPLVSLWQNFSSLDLSADRAAYDYGSEIFKILQPNAIVIADTDQHTFTLWYFAYVVGERPDVAVLNRALLQYAWYRDNVRLTYPQIVMPSNSNDPTIQLIGVIEGNSTRFPIYLTEYDPQIMVRYPFSRQGSLYRLGGE